MARRNIIIISACACACAAAGWLSAEPHAKDAPRTAARTEAPPPARTSTSVAASAPPRVYSDLKLTADEADALKLTPAAFVAKQEAAGGSTQHIARCREALPNEPAALCDRIESTMHDFRLANATLMHELYTGTLEVQAFQERYHKNFLAFQVALEGYLSYDQMTSGYPGVEPGDDPFMVSMGWFFALPPGYTVGDDLLSRGTGDDADDAHSPWSYGPSRMEGTRI